MAACCSVLWCVSLLILAASQDCSGEDQASLEASLVAAVKQALQSYSQEGLRLQEQSNEVLTDMMKDFKEGLRKYNNVMNLLNREVEAYENVSKLTQENQDLKTQLGNRDNKIGALSAEILELKTLLTDKNRTVEKLTQQITDVDNQLKKKNGIVQDLDSRLGECQRRRQELELQVQELNNTVNNPVCMTLEKVPQHLEKIKQVVQAFGNKTDWKTLRASLVDVLDVNSVEYTQIRKAYYPFDIGYLGFSQLASLLLCAGMSVNASDSEGDTLVHGAASGGQLQLVKWLLEHGADIHARGRFYYTPFMRAATAGQLEMVKYLVQAGADPTVKDKDGKTALYWAKYSGHKAVAQYLEQLPQ